MKLTVVLVSYCIVAVGQGVLGAVVERTAEVSKDEQTDEDLYKLPKGLLIGAGVSATQSEGATSEDGKGESVLDRITHTSSRFQWNNDQGADHYHRYKEDLAFAKQMKFTTHRFSISWPRIFPDGNINTPNQKGIQFYHDYIKEIKENGMEPMVTMYHFDHPYVLEVSTNGWTSEKMVEKFVEYADFLFGEYGPQIKYWNPINEGNMYCITIPNELSLAGLSQVDPDATFYKCTHNTILAHAKTYRLYKNKYFKDQKGHVGTSVLMWPTMPVSTKLEDMEAAQVFNEVFAGTMIHPLVYGDYPANSRYLVDKRSFGEQGLNESRLPHFTAEDKKLFEGGPTTDFVALNVYSGYHVGYGNGSAAELPFILKPVILDTPFVKVVDGGGFTQADPEVMKTALLWVWNTYHLPLVITENGYADTTGAGAHDPDRTRYFSANLRSLVRTANQFDVPIISYHAWSLVDLFEFKAGYTGRPFGLIHVDYEGKTLNRTIKDSSKFFIEMAETGRVPGSSSGLSGTPLLLLAMLLAFATQ